MLNTLLHEYMHVHYLAYPYKYGYRYTVSWSVQCIQLYSTRRRRYNTGIATHKDSVGYLHLNTLQTIPCANSGYCDALNI